jgi:MbtH protein
MTSTPAAPTLDDDLPCRVVCNDEEQYSLWPLDRDLPAGWRATGVQGPREACLAHIEQVWTDMRPLSLRRRQAA